jgi:hypothetical protein
MQTPVMHFISNVSLATVVLVIAALVNTALFFLNVSYSRKLRRRRQALLNSEKRLLPGPVTMAMTARFTEKPAASRE